MNKLSKEKFNKEHHSRNMGLLTEDEQQKIGGTTLLIAGCGVGSQIALSAVRIGFEKFVLIDGDTIDVSNNNRQGYSYRDIGRYKVDALGHKIKAINPFATVKKYRVYLDNNNVKRLVKQSDIIIDAIDPYSQWAILDLHKETRSQNKPIVLPLDVGWGARVYVFNHNSITYENLIGIDKISDDFKKNQNLGIEAFAQFFFSISPPYVKNIISDVIEKKLDHYPQPSPASYALASICSVVLKKIALKEKVVLAPKSIAFDAEIIAET